MKLGYWFGKGHVMKNIQSLIERNRNLATFEPKYDSKKQRVIIELTPRGGVDAYTVAKVFSGCSKYLERYGSSYPLLISIKNPAIIDKLAYTVLECICFSLYTEYSVDVHLQWDTKKSITTAGYRYSPLRFINHDRKEFLSKFKRDMQRNHFRELVVYKGNKDQENRLSTNAYAFVSNALVAHGYSEDEHTAFVDQITEAIVELAGNALEHGESDCLIDIDIAPNYIKKSDPAGAYTGVNVSILSFSDKLFGDDISTRLQDVIPLTERFERLNKAEAFHRMHFDKNYTESQFALLAAFQHKISGRAGAPQGDGGTGLTELLKSLQEMSDGDNCYMLTGSDLVYLEKEKIGHDSDNWVGFNRASDFFFQLPDDKVLMKCPFHFPGTAYNLTFVLRKEKSDDSGDN